MCSRSIWCTFWGNYPDLDSPTRKIWGFLVSVLRAFGAKRPLERPKFPWSANPGLAKSVRASVFWETVHQLGSWALFPFRGPGFQKLVFKVVSSGLLACRAAFAAGSAIFCRKLPAATGSGRWLINRGSLAPYFRFQWLK